MSGREMVKRLEALMALCPRPDGLDDAGAPEPEETLVPEPYDAEEIEGDDPC